ncbi:MAG: cytochrome b/b6 domain-containing protein [Chloroflexi bacterium]|nr:cytochrome b/b6 domain-containing protein [Chloroflexota bacterium]
MEQRTLERFRKRTVWIHWLHAASSITLLVTGTIMFFDLTDMSGGHLVRTIHTVTAVFFVAVPLGYLIYDPKTALSFLRTTFRWDRDDLAWLRSSLGFYFGRNSQMPAQGYINGDQKLWQLVVVSTGFLFLITGLPLWFFKLKMAWMLYQVLLLTHALAFVALSVMFLLHVYLTTLNTKFEESLSSMVDGKVSESYARDHYGKWYEQKQNKKA